MIELELLGTSSDGESLVLTDAQGERYSILISDELRGAIRRDRPKVDITPSRPTLAPRDIQALLRAGATPEEIASTHGMDVKAVERFEAPVQAEKDYALFRAQAVRIGEGGPTMGDLVLDRLAARGVEPSSLDWSATREAGEPWQIIVTFVQGRGRARGPLASVEFRHARGHRPGGPVADRTGRCLPLLVDFLSHSPPRAGS